MSCMNTTLYINLFVHNDIVGTYFNSSLYYSYGSKMCRDTKNYSFIILQYRHVIKYYILMCYNVLM